MRKNDLFKSAVLCFALMMCVCANGQSTSTQKSIKSDELKLAKEMGVQIKSNPKETLRNWPLDLFGKLRLGC
jgi:hypothetical protein